ncbi:unnamed protein product, partial [Porites evermanni]
MKLSEVTMMILADFSKAFDKICFRNLITKMSKLVHINEHLKWDDHIKHTVSGCYATLSMLRKLKYLAKYELRKQ